MVTAADVKSAYEGVNGTEAADIVPDKVYTAAAYYADMNDYTFDNEATGRDAVFVALDVLRLAYDGTFSELHADGNYTYEYCNAAEAHVAANPKHKVTVEYIELDDGTFSSRYTSLEARCETEEGPDQPGQPHWWDHVA